MILKVFAKMRCLCKGSEKCLQNNSFSTSQDSQSTDVDSIFDMLEQEKLTKELKIKQKIAKFEREWDLIARNAPSDYAQPLMGLFTETNKKRVDLIADNISDLNPFEARYMLSILKSRALKKHGVPRDFLGNAQDDVIAQPDYRVWAPANPNWSQQQQLIAMLWPLGKEGVAKILQESAKELAAKHGVDLSAIAAQQQQQQTQNKVDAQDTKGPEKAATTKEKTHYEIQLTQVDVAQKIKVIKEVRQAFGLGLKEAKEIVEKAPCTLKKDVKKEEAEDLKAKLEAAGCTITLF